MSTKFSGAEWVQSATKKEMSPFGAHVADILGQVFAGIYHISASVANANWQQRDLVVINIRVPFATYDSNRLTKLVILCHDQCVRLEMNAVAPNCMQLLFTPRSREGDVSHRHPTMEQAITECRELIGIGIN